MLDYSWDRVSDCLFLAIIGDRAHFKEMAKDVLCKLVDSSKSSFMSDICNQGSTSADLSMETKGCDKNRAKHPQVLCKDWLTQESEGLLTKNNLGFENTPDNRAIFRRNISRLVQIVRMKTTYK